MKKEIKQLVDKYAELQIMVCPDRYKAVVETEKGKKCKCCGGDIVISKRVQGFGITPERAISELVSVLKGKKKERYI